MNVMEKDRSVHAEFQPWDPLLVTSQTKTNIDGGRGSLVSASELKPEDPGFDPLAGQGDTQFFSVPPNQLLCRLVCA